MTGPGFEPGTPRFSVMRRQLFILFIGFDRSIKSAYLCRIRTSRPYRAVIEVRYGQPGCSKSDSGAAFGEAVVAIPALRRTPLSHAL